VRTDRASAAGCVRLGLLAGGVNRVRDLWDALARAAPVAAGGVDFEEQLVAGKGSAPVGNA
jgi:hypothetical protein